MPRPAALALAAVAVTAGPARADHWFMDVEPVAIHTAGEGRHLSSMFVISVGRAGRGRVAPYVAAGAGFLNVQARAGALIALGGSSWVARFEVRPQVSIVCAETGVFGGAGLGYRFAGDGTPVTVLAAAEGGPGWTHRGVCGPGSRSHDAERAWFGGGTLSVAFGL